MVASCSGSSSATDWRGRATMECLAEEHSAMVAAIAGRSLARLLFGGPRGRSHICSSRTHTLTHSENDITNSFITLNLGRSVPLAGIRSFVRLASAAAVPGLEFNQRRGAPVRCCCCCCRRCAECHSLQLPRHSTHLFCLDGVRLFLPVAGARAACHKHGGWT